MSDNPTAPDPHAALELVSLFCGTEPRWVDEQAIRASMMNPFTRQPIDFRAQYNGSADDEGWVVQFFEDYDAADRTGWAANKPRNWQKPSSVRGQR